MTHNQINLRGNEMDKRGWKTHFLTHHLTWDSNCHLAPENLKRDVEKAGANKWHLLTKRWQQQQQQKKKELRKFNKTKLSWGTKNKKVMRAWAPERAAASFLPPAPVNGILPPRNLEIYITGEGLKKLLIKENNIEVVQNHLLQRPAASGIWARANG